MDGKVGQGFIKRGLALEVERVMEQLVKNNIDQRLVIVAQQMG